MSQKILKSSLALAISVASTYSLASGFALNEQSISGMGTGFAGRSSSAEDATTLYGNPAGMSRLKREQVSAGAAVVFAKTDIKKADGNLNGSNDGDMVPVVGVPMGYYVKPIDDKVSFGIGMYVPFGLVTDYESDFQGRYFGDKSQVQVITLQPTVSYRFNDNLSIGFGPTINHISGELTSKIPSFTPDDGKVKIKGDDVAVGYNFGVLYEFNEHVRAGVTYHSKVDYKLEGDTKISAPDGSPLNALGLTGKYDASLDITTPESVDMSLTYDINDQWTVYAGSTFTRWSRLEDITVDNEGVSAPFATITEEQNWHDTWAHAIGAAYKLNKQWVLRAGLAVDQSPANNTDRSPRIPTGDRKILSLGAGWSPTEDMTIDVAYSYLKEDDAKINNSDPLRGNYSSTYENSAHGLGAQVTYRF
ncbi:OmpP1/FadL family transporter [Pseudomonas sp. EL_65y_Pfl2_R95]|uniref:OmpP1/FadL family transporter n=1 Tax=Pseudomonas sp. EL_65y_Pfl2_R95 TaxID=3088698 RepID=UPI0030D8AF3E